MKIENLLDRLENVTQRSNNSWMVSCPCSNNHETGDSHPSLSVSVGEDGRILLYCFKGCGVDEVCSSLGISTADLFNDEGSSSATDPDYLMGNVRLYADKNNLQYIAEYDYQYGGYKDGLRKIRFKDKATGAKTFRWIHPDPDHPSKYIWSHAGLPNRLYVAGDLQKDSKILVVEGEKDAKTARILFGYKGITAVSAENGASAGSTSGKWMQSYSQQLTGKTVYVIADNDDTGQRFARSEAASIAGYAEQVYILDLKEVWKDCPAKGDISDMAAQLGWSATVTGIEQLMQAAEPYVPSDSDEINDPWDRFLCKIQTQAYKPIQTGLPFFDELMGGGILSQSLILLMAAPGIGKTALCQQLAEEIAAKGDEVIYLNLEMSTEQMQARALSYWLAKEQKYYSMSQILQGYNWHDTQKQDIMAAVRSYKGRSAPFISYNPQNVGNSIERINNYLDEIGEAAIISGKRAPVIIIDYLHLIRSEKEKDLAEIIKKAVYELKQYAMRYNTFVIAISATNRTSNDSGQIYLSSGRDSSNLEYTADYVLALNYEELESGAVRPTEAAEMERLQSQKYRELRLRALKSRLSAPGKSVNIYFDAAHNIFYGEDDYAALALSPMEQMKRTISVPRR